MITTTKSATLFGIDAKEITIEVDASKGLPAEHIVGLPDTVIKESKNRIKSAIKNAGFEYPIKAYTINLAPANLPKEGPLLDLAIAIGVLQSTNQLPDTPDTMFIGELSLNGNIRPIQGIISVCHLAISLGIKRIFIPEDNLQEAALIPNAPLIPVKHLKDIPELLKKPPTYSTPDQTTTAPPINLDFSEVKGQFATKRALEIAAAGRHNILLIGSPGSGKTMLLKRLPEILPELSIDKAITTYKIHSIHHQEHKHFQPTPPFRHPHHTISYAGMVGGGKTPKPGEISLAHNGILFLDELPEFNRQVLETLRQPLENKHITISRANFTVDFPADIMLVAAMNPCPCGFFKDPEKECICHSHQIKKYWKKISGPILDRIDLIIEVPRLTKNDYLKHAPAQSPFQSSSMRHRIQKARSIQNNRFKTDKTNSEASQKDFKHHFKLNSEIQSFLGNAVEKGILTGRSHDKVIKVARTIADLNEHNEIKMEHILEAFQYRTSLKC